jgi:hypothetical protein
MLVPLPQGCFAHREASSPGSACRAGGVVQLRNQGAGRQVIEGEDGAEGLGLVAD